MDTVYGSKDRAWNEDHLLYRVYGSKHWKSWRKLRNTENLNIEKIKIWSYLKIFPQGTRSVTCENGPRYPYFMAIYVLAWKPRLKNAKRHLQFWAKINKKRFYSYKKLLSAQGMHVDPSFHCRIFRCITWYYWVFDLTSKTLIFGSKTVKIPISSINLNVLPIATRIPIIKIHF